MHKMTQGFKNKEISAELGASKLNIEVCILGLILGAQKSLLLGKDENEVLSILAI